MVYSTPRHGYSKGNGLQCHFPWQAACDALCVAAVTPVVCSHHSSNTVPRLVISLPTAKWQPAQQTSSNRSWRFGLNKAELRLPT